jgi:uncharacterized membrane protein
MKMKNLILVTLSLVLLVCLAVSAAAENQNVVIDYIKINGDEITLESGELNHVFERGEELEIKINVKALQDAENVVIDANIKGYRYANQEDGLSDSTDTFDLDENDVVTKTLDLVVPLKADKDYYDLRLTVSDRSGASDEYLYSIRVSGVDKEEAIEIRDYSFSPSNEIGVGRPLLAQVTVKNYGDRDLDDVKVTVAIPDLNVRDSETLDEIDADESETFEELLLRIPTDAQPGIYTVEITVEYDEYESSVVTDLIEVVCQDESGVCGVTTVEQATVVNVPNTVELTANGAAFPITIKNNGANAVVYSLGVSGINWGSFRFDPAADFIVDAGDAKTVYLYIDADTLEVGEKYFKLQVNDGEESSEVALSVVVSEENASTNLRSALEIGLIILVVILIIIGLIIGFSKLKDNKNDDEAEAYY